MLDDELTMEKWDQLAMFLQEWDLAELLKNIYLSMD